MHVHDEEDACLAPEQVTPAGGGRARARDARRPPSWRRVRSAGPGVRPDRARGRHARCSVIEHAITDAEIPTGGGKDVKGNILTFNNPVYNAANTKQVGHDEGFCTRISVAEQAVWECLWTTFLKGGQITVQGPYYDNAQQRPVDHRRDRRLPRRPRPDEAARPRRRQGVRLHLRAQLPVPSGRRRRDRRAAGAAAARATWPTASPSRSRPRRPAADRARRRRPSPATASSLTCSASAAGPSNRSSSWIWSTSRELSPASVSAWSQRDHRHLHDVGRGALDDHVDREALALLAQLPAARAQLGDLAAAAEQRRDVAVLGALLDRLLDEPPHGREAGQVALDELVGLRLRDVEPVGHPVGRQAVDDPVVDHLGLRAHARVDLRRA